MGVGVREPLVQAAQLVPLELLRRCFRVHSALLVSLPAQKQRCPSHLIRKILCRCPVHTGDSFILQGFRDRIELGNVLFKALTDLIFEILFIPVCSQDGLLYRFSARYSSA